MRPRRLTIKRMATPNPIKLPLCEYDDARDQQSLRAVIDEPTLTCTHLPSLEAAKRWACAFRDERQRKRSRAGGAKECMTSVDRPGVTHDQ